MSTLSNQSSSSKLSIYRDKIATGDDIKPFLNTLAGAFPELSDDFFIILSQRILSNKFTVQRTIDSVNNLIDNFTYKKPNIADIISWDKRIDLYTYQDIIEKVNAQGPAVWGNYKKIKTAHTIKMWASVTDIENYNLEIL